MSNARELAKAAASYGSGGFVGMKNRVINGDMRIDQRNAGASILTSSSNYYGVDRFPVSMNGTGVLAMQQVADAPAGFYNSLKLTVSTAQATLTANQYYQLLHNIEGYNLLDVGFGTANAQPMTLSFWVKSSLTGTFGFRLTNGDGSRSYPTSYTINTANTWQYVTIQIPPCTTGAWDRTNNIAFACSFGFTQGSTYNGATPNTWNTTTGYAASNVAWSNSFIATAGATWQITGVQLEKGSQATSFEYRHYGTEMTLCNRYYTTLTSSIRHYSTDSQYGYYAPISLPTAMRATPTTTVTAQGIGTTGTLTAQSNGNNIIFVQFTGNTGMCNRDSFTVACSSEL